MQEYDAIIVLGAGLLADDSPSPTTGKRVMHGVELFRQGKADTLLLSGGRGGNSITEADAMRSLAVAAGVPDDCILLERLSRSTLENAIYSARLMQDRGWLTALIVSDRLHMPRALLAFDSVGVRTTGSVSRGPGIRDPWRWFAYAVHEFLGLLWYVALILYKRRRH